MIVLIDNYDSFTYNLYQLLAADHEVTVLRNDKTTLAEIAALAPSHIVLSPGPGMPADAGMCVEIIQHFSDKNVPILGVCLGHQAIVEAFGGKITLAPTVMHGKEAKVFHHRQGMYQGLSLPFTAGRYHSLHAERDDIPDCLIVESETGDGVVMGVKHKSLPVYGLQFHPESILTPEGGVIVKNFLKGSLL